LDSNATQDKHLLIITGPQGSGNHIFSRVFSMHPDVRGWEQLKDQYWVPSDQEPFAEYWVYPERLTAEVFEDSCYFLANVSAPFFYDGVRQMPHIREVADRARSFGIKVSIGIVVRDISINTRQQQRVGGEITLYAAQEYYRTQLIDSEYPVYFLDHEALFSWGAVYVRNTAGQIGFPVDLDRCLYQLEINPNLKYITPVEEHWLDAEIREGRRTFADRVLDRLRDTPESP